MCNFGVLSTPRGLAGAVVLLFEPAIYAEHPLLYEADVLEIIVVILVAGQVLLQTHYNYNQLSHDHSINQVDLFIRRIMPIIIIYQ